LRRFALKIARVVAFFCTRGGTTIESEVEELDPENEAEDIMALLDSAALQLVCCWL